MIIKLKLKLIIKLMDLVIMATMATIALSAGLLNRTSIVLFDVPFISRAIAIYTELSVQYFIGHKMCCL